MMEGSLPSCLARILMAYRITPQTTTGVSPAELILGYQPCTRLDLLKPNIGGRVEGKQRQQKLYHDNSARIRQFNVGDKVYGQNFGQGQRWLPGQIQEVTGPVSFLIEFGRWPLPQTSSGPHKNSQG